MKKKNIRKYILEALAVLLVIGACLTINELSRREALADPDTYEFESIATTFNALSESNRISQDDIKSDIESHYGSATINVKKNDVRDGTCSATITWNNGPEGSYTPSDSSATLTWKGTVASSVTYSNDSGDHTVTIPSENQEVTVTVNVAAADIYTFDSIVALTALDETNGKTQGEIKSDLETERRSATVKVKRNGVYVGDCTSQITWNNSPEGGAYTPSASSATLTWKGTIPSTVTYNGHSVDIPSENQEITVTVNVAAATTPITWSGITVTPTINVNGTRDTSGKTVSEYTYQVVDNNGTVLRGGITGASPLSGSATATGALADNYKIKLTGAKVDGTVYTPTGTIETTGYNTSSYVISGTLSPVINVTTKPSEYNKLKAAVVKNDDDDYIEISKIDTDLRDSILDYVYENNVNGLKSVIQDIMNSGSDLSIKVVSKKLDSSDVDSDVKKDLKKEAQKPSGAGSADILNYYDITVYLTKDGRENSAWKVTNTGSDNKIKVTLKAKSSSSSSSGKRYYMALIYHSGDADNLTDYDTSNSITVKTHKFSTYAVSYYDSSSSSSSSASTPKSNSAIVPGDDGTGAGAGGTDKSKTPKTGDDFNPRIWIYLLIVCATVASAAWILLQDTREDNEKKQK